MPQRGRTIARSVLGKVARGPRPIAEAFLLLLSLVSRNFLSELNQQRVRNLCHYQPWPDFAFGPRSIVLGRQTAIWLVPHVGEFDGQALYMRRLDYEREVFRWLESKAADYDLIIEIGANVGIYTVFFDALRRKRSADAVQAIVSFEPAPEPYRRLQRNLEINGARVVTVPAAVGAESGRRDFYEPVGHLTNGSFLQDFAAIFADKVERTTVDTMAAADLEQWLAPARKALIKIDVEGYEPELLTALAPLLDKYRPDLLVEVMPSTADRLQADPTLARYDRFLVTDQGLQPETAFYFAEPYFDWFLTWRS